MKIENFKRKWAGRKYNNAFTASSIVGIGSEVKNSRLGEYSRLKPYVEFRSSVLGDYSFVSSYSIVNGTDIGKFTSIGPGVFIGLWEHNMWVSMHSFYLSEVCGGFVKGIKNYESDKIKVKIGNDVWIGAGAIILKGVTIGDGAVIGAGAVITKNVEPYAIVIGNPQKALRYRFKKQDIEFLLKTRWWNFGRDTLKDMIGKNVWRSLEKFKTYCRSKRLVNRRTVN